MPELTIESIQFDPTRAIVDDGVLCQLSDGRVFVTLASEVGKYAEDGDGDPLIAFRKAWRHDPGLFAGPILPRAAPSMPVLTPESSSVELEHGFSGDLTPKDRARLHSIIRKYHRFYFADEPTPAQMDNLLDGLGLKVAEAEVRRRVDKGIID